MKFIVVAFMLMSLNHLNLSFVHGDGYGSIFALHVDIQLYQYQLLKRLSFFHYLILGFFVKIQVFKGV